MSIPTVNVTVVVIGQNGAVIPNATVMARLKTIETYNGYVLPEITTGTTDVNGIAILAVFPNQLGSEGSEYEFSIYNPLLKKTIHINAVIPNNDCNLWDVASLPPYDRTSSSVGYTDLTQFTAQTAWRLFYSDGNGAVTELPLGASGTYLKSAGANVAPVFDTPVADVVGPASAVDNDIAVFDLTTGKLIKDSGKKTTDFATATQGALADSAIQPTDTVDALSDITSSGANIEDAVSKRHIQNTDTSLGLLVADINMNLHKVINSLDPTDPQDLATMAWVGKAVAASSYNFFLTNNVADVATYYYGYDTDLGEPQSVLTSPTMTVGNDQLLWNFISEANKPNLNLLSQGIFAATAFLNKTGNKDVAVYWKLFKRDSGGTETLLITSPATGNLSATVYQITNSAAQSADIYLLTTDRLVFKFYANVTGTGTDVSVTITMENTNDSRVSFPVTSNSFLNVFATVAQGALADTAIQPTDTVNALSDITSAGVYIEDAVTKRHTQNTDTGTSSAEFNIDTGGTPVPVKATLDAKVDKIAGKGLSANDYVNADKAKVDYISVTQATNLDTMESDIASLSSAVVLKGVWDASAGTFPSGANAGYSYIVSVSGTVDSVDFTANDRIVAIIDSASTTVYSNNWHKLDYTDQVLSVASKTGAVTLVKADVGLGNVTNTSDTSKPVSTAQQTALDGKANKGSNSDITSLSGLTTALSKAQGGTGNTTGDASSVIGKIPIATPTANAIPIADENGKLDRWLTSTDYTIGVAGTQGFGVGAISDADLPAGWLKLSGHSDPASPNYGNVYDNTGSVMVWVPAFYFMWDSSNICHISATPKTGYALARDFIDGSQVKNGRFYDKYGCGNVGGIFSSVQGIDPCSTNSVHNPIGNLNGTPSNTYGGIYAAAKTRGADHSVMSVFGYNALAMLSVAQSQAGTIATCAYNDVAPYLPKGCNNNALGDANDGSVAYTSSGYSNCGLTGSGVPFAKTTHNGQNCGIADLNGNMWEVASGLIQIATGATEATFKVLKESSSTTNFLDDSATAGTGAYDLSLYDTLDLTGIIPTTADTVYFGNAANQVFGMDTDRTSAIYKETSAGIPQALGISAGGTTQFGNDGFWRNIINGLACIRGGSWSFSSGAGVFTVYLYNSRTNSSDNRGGRTSYSV